MIVMLHGIQRDPSVSDPKQITLADFHRMMEGLHEQGFQAINATQLADFLDINAAIPARSVVLIQDDRHSAENFEDFRPYWEEWAWPVVTAWISALGGGDPVLQGNVALSAEGWVDYQAHGVVHNINMSDSSTDEFIEGELQGSITNIQTYFGKTPIAIIWPGGGFGVRPVQVARRLGYRLGFTVNPRGPVMFNWVPLADAATPGRADMLSEGYVNDPRMTLPRYWPSQVLEKLDQVRVMGEEAAAYAQQNRAVEMDYYEISCLPTYGAIP
jgi:peptidoglycan/xylan/chitin deacetylase (PgdA/CDA1 family)